MFYVYVLKSTRYNWYYVGLTIDIGQRLFRHETGREKTTRFYKPFQVIFVQECNTRNDARDLEKYLKIRSNKENLLTMIAEVVKLVDTQS